MIKVLDKTIDEIEHKGSEYETVDDLIKPDILPEQEANPGASEDDDGFEIDFSFLTKKTGEGSIEDYIEHPLNFNGSQPIAQIIRGLTGMFTDLNLAIIDIVIGFFKMRRGDNVQA